jgi:glycosyltransferase involved in cell wall biosynthesis
MDAEEMGLLHRDEHTVSASAKGEPRHGDSAVVGRGIKVLHVFKYFYPDFTGEGLYTQKIQALLQRHGVRADVLVIYTAKRTETTEEDETAGFDEIFYFGLGAQREQAALIPLLRFFLRHARAYDLIHFHSQVDRSFSSHLLLKLFGVPIVRSCTLDDSPGEIIRSYRPLRRWLARHLMGSIDRFITISPRLYQDGLRIYSKAKVTMIPQGVSLPATSVADRSAAPSRGQRDGVLQPLELLYVGAIQDRKDVIFLIEALPLLRARLNGRFDVRLKIVGPDLEWKSYGIAVRRRVRDLDLEGCVAFLGYVRDPEQYYLDADLFVFASVLEGFGNAIIEAMSYGLPVVVRTLPGVTDFIVESGRNGFLFGDANDYIETVVRLADDPALRQEVGRQARADVGERFSLESISHRYRALYEELVG